MVIQGFKIAIVGLLCFKLSLMLLVIFNNSERNMANHMQQDLYERGLPSDFVGRR
jgi:hypothetical protein